MPPTPRSRRSYVARLRRLPVRSLSASCTSGTARLGRTATVGRPVVPCKVLGATVENVVGILKHGHVVVALHARLGIARGRDTHEHAVGVHAQVVTKGGARDDQVFVVQCQYDRKARQPDAAVVVRPASPQAAAETALRHP